MEPKVREAFLAERERQKTLPDRNIVIDGYSGWVFLNRYGLVLSPKSVNDAIDSIISKYNAIEKETASLEEIRSALADFKESGKFVVAYADQYILAVF